MITMVKQFNQVSIERIALFEQAIGYKLPDEYKEFIIQYNGGRPERRVFDIPRLRDIDELNYFYGIDAVELYDLYKIYTIYKERIPAGLLPIADDPFDNQVCISLIGVSRGNIYFWDHELEHLKKVTILSNSFDSFLNNLRKDA